MVMKMFQFSSALGQAVDELVRHKLMNRPRKETQLLLVIFSPKET